MRASLIALATTLAYVSAQRPQVTAAPGSLALGAQCSSKEQCAGGADCYATNSNLIPVCGNFQAVCTSDSQCAFNACNNGFCNGALLSSSTTEGSQPTDGPQPAPSPTVTAAPGTLPVGAECADSVQCANGADCYATNFMLIRRCGNFQASCSRDDQCAFNTCNGGLCNGFISSSSTTAEPTDGPQPAPSPTVTAAPGTLPVGAECADSVQCANGADCYATNFMLIRRCGNFQATCSRDDQCAFNTCNGGLCNGFISSSSATDGTPSTTTPSETQNTPPIPTVTAPAGSVPLGGRCSTTEQCANGAMCYATNSNLIPACGNFQAACSSDSQCAFNKCNNGFCNGELLSSSMTTVASPTYAGNSSATNPPVPPPTYTGAATKQSVGVAGLIGAIIVAFAL